MADIKQEDTVKDGAGSLTNESVGSQAATEEIWDEARLEAGLARLQDMYRQVRELRSTIPNLVAPLTVRQTSPEILHRRVTKSVMVANEEVKAFRHLMEDESSRKIFEYAKESRAQNPKGIKPFKITDFPDWYEKRV